MSHPIEAAVHQNQPMSGMSAEVMRRRTELSRACKYKPLPPNAFDYELEESGDEDHGSSYASTSSNIDQPATSAPPLKKKKMLFGPGVPRMQAPSMAPARETSRKKTLSRPRVPRMQAPSMVPRMQASSMSSPSMSSTYMSSPSMSPAREISEERTEERNAVPYTFTPTWYYSSQPHHALPAPGAQGVTDTIDLTNDNTVITRAVPTHCPLTSRPLENPIVNMVCGHVYDLGPWCELWQQKIRSHSFAQFCDCPPCIHIGLSKFRCIQSGCAEGMFMPALTPAGGALCAMIAAQQVRHLLMSEEAERVRARNVVVVEN